MFEDYEEKHPKKVDVEIRTPTFLSCERAIFTMGLGLGAL